MGNLLPKALTERPGALRPGRRRFNWISSVDPNAASRLESLSSQMGEFYSKPKTRNVYQTMVDADSSAQPLVEGALRKAVLAGRPRTVLEVGCGSARIYERLRDEGFVGHYTGVELAPEVISTNGQRFPDAEWHVGSGYALPVAPDSQDCVFAFYVLEHCVYPERFLDSLLSVVKPGGRLALTFPDMVASRYFESQALGWSRHTAKEHLKAGRILHALVRIWDTRFRLPAALRSASRKIGSFPVNLTPQCLEPDINILPDVDAIYIASREEVHSWAEAKGCRVEYPAGAEGQLYVNVFVQITKAAAKD